MTFGAFARAVRCRYHMPPGRESSADVPGLMGEEGERFAMGKISALK